MISCCTHRFHEAPCSAGSRGICITRRARRSNRAKLGRIKELLIRTDLPLNDIARVLGFEHFETMHRFFKANVGTTPSFYRAAHRSASVIDAANAVKKPRAKPVQSLPAADSGSVTEAAEQ